MIPVPEGAVWQDHNGPDYVWWSCGNWMAHQHPSGAWHLYYNGNLVFKDEYLQNCQAFARNPPAPPSPREIAVDNALRAVGLTDSGLNKLLRHALGELYDKGFLKENTDVER